MRWRKHSWGEEILGRAGIVQSKGGKVKGGGDQGLSTEYIKFCYRRMEEFILTVQGKNSEKYMKLNFSRTHFRYRE